MPTRWRRRRRSVFGSLTVTPSTTMRPDWIGSSPLMQRSSVLLPEPERPMMAMISPRSTSREMPSSTVSGPNRLVTSAISTSGMEPPFQPAAPLGEREAEREIKRGDGEVDGERLEGRGSRGLALAGQLDEADGRGERGVLDQLDEESHGRRRRDPERLRHDHVAQLMAEAEAERGAGLPLRLRDGGERAAPDLAEEGAGIDRQRRDGGGPGIDREAEDGKPEIKPEDPHQQRRALDQLGVRRAEQSQRRYTAEAQQRHDRADEAAADTGGCGQRQRPAQRGHEKQHVDPGE